MIINRFAKALQEQNWFTVILEILIVVIGIFPGLQVDDPLDFLDRHQTSL